MTVSAPVCGAVLEERTLGMLDPTAAAFRYEVALAVYKLLETVAG